MRKALITFSLSLAVLAPIAARAGSLSYDAVNDFSISNGNPNDVWSYGYGTPGVSFTADAVSGTNYAGSDDWQYWVRAAGPTLPVVAYSPTGTGFGSINLPNNVLEMHPDDADIYASIVRFTAPVTASYSIAGLFERVDTMNGVGNGVFVSVYKGSTALDGPTLLGLNYLDSSTFSNTVSLTSGQTLDFIVARNGAYGNDSTGLSVTINGTVNPVPEPSSIALLGTGILSAAGFARRRFKA